MGGALRGSVFLIRVGMVAAGLIDAARLFGHDVAGDAVSAGAGSAADIAVFAGVPLAVELVRVAQLQKDGRLLINVRERVVVQVAAFDGEETAGVDLADVGDEDEAAPVVDALGGPADSLVFGALGGMAGVDGPAGMRGGASTRVVVNTGGGA